MVYPADKQIFAFSLNDTGKLVGHRPFVEGEKASPVLFPDLTIDLTDLFPPPDWVEEPYASYLQT
jgi:hypothetical protein